VRHDDDGVHDRGVRGVRVVRGEVPAERTVDLDLVDGKAGETGQAREAGAEVVDDDVDAELAGGVEDLDDVTGIVHQDAFGDLQPRLAGSNPESFRARVTAASLTIGVRGRRDVTNAQTCVRTPVQAR
jgi:hypothetical protein